MTTAPETSLNGLDTVPTSGSRLTAVGKTIYVGRRAATADGEVRNGEWRLVAHSATTCLIHR
jgi:acyl-coenzyme A thioesterase PaaI-like protein